MQFINTNSWIKIRLLKKKSLVYNTTYYKHHPYRLLSIYFTRKLIKKAIGIASAFWFNVYATIIADHLIPLRTSFKAFIENNLFKGNLCKDY